MTITRDYQKDAGLCGTCRHSRPVKSTKGSIFRLCELSRLTAAFPKYPRLPVRLCAGHEVLSAPEPAKR